MPSRTVSPLKIAVSDPVMTVATFCDRFQGRIRIGVTSTGAVAQFRSRIPGTRAFDFLMFPRIKIPLVTTRAGRLQARRLPGDRLGIVGVTRFARDARVVITGVIRCGVRKANGRPRRRRMAGAAVLCGHEVASRFAYCARAIMARGAITGDALMIEGAADERRRRMAVGAIQRRRDVIGRFSNGGGAVVT